MFFLLRTAFWLTIVLALIPLGAPQTPDAPETPGVDPVSAFFAAQETVSDIGGFCSRNPNACETGGHAMTAIGTQAVAGAGIVFAYLDRTFFDGAARSATPATLPEAPATLPAPELADASGGAPGILKALGETFVTGSLPSSPAAAAKQAGTLTRQDLALPWDGKVDDRAQTRPTQAAQRAPIGLPKPNPRAGMSGRGAGSQAGNA
ncbi:DUF5330 domain-containing protein [Roseibium sp.]|uniref:DUF5330 domain-containing protein n=1 Tax=Roseibium sp. TaxID=1936156 RepID=UPI003A984D73